MPLFFTTCHLHELPSVIELSKHFEHLTVGIVDTYEATESTLIRHKNNPKISFVCFDKIVAENDIKLYAEKYTTDEVRKIAKVLFFKYLYSDLKNKDLLVYLTPKSYPQFPHSIVDNLALKDIFLLPKTTQSFAHKDEKTILNSGMFSADFWAVRKSESGQKFLDWWLEKITSQGYIKPCEGMNGDELWLNHVPVFFENVQILRDQSFLGEPIAVKNLKTPLPSLGQYTPPKPFIAIRKPIADTIINVGKSIDKMLSDLAFRIWKS